MKGFYLLGALAIGACTASSSANACSIIVNPDLTYSEKLKNAHHAIESARAIIDAEVVRPGEGGTVALIYAHRVLKGPDNRWVEVISGTGGDCRREFSRGGERMRLFIYQSPEGLVSYDEGDTRLEDRLLKSDRSKDYPYFAGPRRLIGQM